MARTLTMDPIELLHFLKTALEALKGSYNNPATVYLRTGKATMTLVAAGFDVVQAKQFEHSRHNWRVTVDLDGLGNRFRLCPSNPPRIVVGER